MTFPIVAFPGGANLTLSLIGHQESASGSSSYTFNYTFSTANPGRIIIGIASWLMVSGAAITVGMTIGGIAATPLGGIVGSLGAAQMALFYAVVPTNANQTAVVNFSRNASECGCALYDLEGASAVHAAITTGSSPPFSATVNVPAGGCALGASFGQGSGSTANTWTGISKDFDTQITSNRPYSGAHGNFPFGSAGLVVTDTLNGTPSQQVTSLVVFSP